MYIYKLKCTDILARKDQKEVELRIKEENAKAEILRMKKEKELARRKKLQQSENRIKDSKKAKIAALEKRIREVNYLVNSERRRNSSYIKQENVYRRAKEY